MSFSPTIYAGQSNRGIDRTITITRNDNKQYVQIGGRLNSIEWSDKDTIEETDGIDNGGRTDHQRFAGGISGTININRYNGDLEAFMKTVDATFYGGQNQIYCTITMVTNNGFDGTTDTDTFTQAVLGKMSSGPFQSKQIAKCKIEFAAQERL